jgi:stalled ribosome rescue protein Dom34
VPCHDVQADLDFKAMDSFYAAVYQAILRLIPFQTLKAVVIASPGFTKESVSHSITKALFSSFDDLVVRLYLPTSYVDE